MTTLETRKHACSLKDGSGWTRVPSLWSSVAYFHTLTSGVFNVGIFTTKIIFIFFDQQYIIDILQFFFSVILIACYVLVARKIKKYYYCYCSRKKKKIIKRRRKYFEKFCMCFFRLFIIEKNTWNEGNSFFLNSFFLNS